MNPTGIIKISPLARKLAEEKGIEVSTVQGSGPQGRIVEADILAALEARNQGSQPAVSQSDVPYKLQTLSSGRRVVAVRMSESFRTIPHFYLNVELDVAALVELRARLLEDYDGKFGLRLTYTDFLLKALALTLPGHPLLNAAYHSDTDIKLYEEINLGVAISGEWGLVAGVVRRADRMTLGEIAQACHSLVSKAQQRKLSPQDISGGTFTFTNLGMYGIDNFSPIINPGQSAILAAGAIVERPAGVGGQVVVRPTLRATLAVDHRIADGLAGALFLKDLRSVLDAPEALLK